MNNNDRLLALYVLYACAVMPPDARAAMKKRMVEIAVEGLHADMDNPQELLGRFPFDASDKSWLAAVQV